MIINVTNKRTTQQTLHSLDGLLFPSHPEISILIKFGTKVSGIITEPPAFGDLVSKFHDGVMLQLINLDTNTTTTTMTQVSIAAMAVSRRRQLIRYDTIVCI